MQKVYKQVPIAKATKEQLLNAVGQKLDVDNYKGSKSDLISVCKVIGITNIKVRVL